MSINLNNYKNKTILVTGAAGFIGSHLSESLIDLGAKVIGIDNFNSFYSPEIKHKNIDKLSKLDNFKLYEFDLCDYDKLSNIFINNKINIVFHIAAYAGVRPSVTDPILYNNVNNTSTINLAHLAVEHNIEKFIFASSSSVYGSRDEVPFREDQDISKPVSPYAATKVAGEAMLHALSHTKNLSCACLRFFTVYGPRQRPDLAISKFTQLINNNQAIPVYGDGNFQRDFTYIEDIIDGVLKSGLDSRDFEIYNLGESETHSVLELIEKIEIALNKKAIIDFQDPVIGDVPITFADISKARKYIDYNPQTKLSDGIQKYVNWYLTQESLVS